MHRWCSRGFYAFGSGARLRGPLRVTLETDTRRETFQALANPFSALRDTLVFRRSSMTAGNTFALEAEICAKDLPRSFIAALKTPTARLEVTLEEIPDAPFPGALMLLLEPLEGPLSDEAKAHLGAAEAVAGSEARLREGLDQEAPAIGEPSPLR